MNCCKRQFTLIAIIAIGLSLFLSKTSSAQRQTPLNPNSIQGYKNLCADLDGDGHTERVCLAGSYPQYQITVLNDKGKTVWRSEYDDNISQYYANARHCLLHDIDGDGSIELVISGWDDDDMLLDDGIVPPFTKLGDHPIYRWGNDRFTRLDKKMRLSTSKGSDVCKFDTSYCDYVNQNGKLPKYHETGHSLIHNLRKVNGQVWGDILLCSSDKFMSMSLPKDVKYIKDTNGRYYWFQTVRLATCPGGMRIVEHKQFYP
ncbi:MAG: hypothetical protein Q4F00_05350 [bacterium]|nr:hypothetical protein [bacterium]